MRCRGDLWSPVYDYDKLLFNGIICISRIMRYIGFVILHYAQNDRILKHA